MQGHINPISVSASLLSYAPHSVLGLYQLTYRLLAVYELQLYRFIVREWGLSYPPMPLLVALVTGPVVAHGLREPLYFLPSKTILPHHYGGTRGGLAWYIAVIGLPNISISALGLDAI